MESLEVSFRLTEKEARRFRRLASSTLRFQQEDWVWVLFIWMSLGLPLIWDMGVEWRIGIQPALTVLWIAVTLGLIVKCVITPQTEAQLAGHESECVVRLEPDGLSYKDASLESMSPWTGFQAVKEKKTASRSAGTARPR